MLHGGVAIREILGLGVHFASRISNTSAGPVFGDFVQAAGTVNYLTAEFPFWEPREVRVISRRAIRTFAERHPDAMGPLLHWANATEAVDWKTPGDVRRTFNTADFVGDLTVFDVGGNKYRVIAFVHYRRRAVYIKDVLTHKEYGKGVWRR